MIRIFRGSIVLLWVLCGNVALTSAADDITALLKDKSVTELIGYLGDASFAKREAAAAELVKRGGAATEELQATLDDPDLEIRLRAQQVLSRIAKANLEARLTAFVEDPDGRQAHNLPAWEQFQAQFGGGRESRELFAEMMRSEAAFLKSLEEDKDDLSADYNQRILSLQENVIPGLDRNLSPASLATLLFVGGNEHVSIDTTAGYQMYSLLSRSSSTDPILKSSHSFTMKKLLANWLKRSSVNGSLARNSLMLAQRYAMNDTGLELGRMLLSQEDVPSYVLPYAILAVGQFGEKRDSSAIEPCLNDETVCHSWHNPKFKEVIRVQVRDVALATLLYLNGLEPKDFGFNLLKEDPNSLFYVYTMGFPEESEREAALSKWREWQQGQKENAHRS